MPLPDTERYVTIVSWHNASTVISTHPGMPTEIASFVVTIGTPYSEKTHLTGAKGTEEPANRRSRPTAVNARAAANRGWISWSSITSKETEHSTGNRSLAARAETPGENP